MQTYQIKTVISEEGVLKIDGLPVHTGDRVEVIVKKQSSGNSKDNLYPLRGTSIHYKAPFDSVAERDWEIH